MRQPDPLRRTPARVRFRPSFPAVLLGSIGAALLLASALEAIRSVRASGAGFPGAQWIWISKAPARAPVHFSASRKFLLEAVPSRATARIFVDRSFELRVNGAFAGRGTRSPEGAASSFEIGSLLHAGENVVTVSAESPDGVGGILFALTNEKGGRIVVSDRYWTVVPAGSAPSGPAARPAEVLGAPPRYPWRNVASADRALRPLATGVRLARMRARPDGCSRLFFERSVRPRFARAAYGPGLAHRAHGSRRVSLLPSFGRETSHAASCWTDGTLRVEPPLLPRAGGKGRVCA